MYFPNVYAFEMADPKDYAHLPPLKQVIDEPSSWILPLRVNSKRGRQLEKEQGIHKPTMAQEPKPFVMKLKIKRLTLSVAIPRDVGWLILDNGCHVDKAMSRLVDAMQTNKMEVIWLTVRCNEKVKDMVFQHVLSLVTTPGSFLKYLHVQEAGFSREQQDMLIPLFHHSSLKEMRIRDYD